MHRGIAMGNHNTADPTITHTHTHTRAHTRTRTRTHTHSPWSVFGNIFVLIRLIISAATERTVDCRWLIICLVLRQYSEPTRVCVRACMCVCVRVCACVRVRVGMDSASFLLFICSAGHLGIHMLNRIIPLLPFFGGNADNSNYTRGSEIMRFLFS